jgi:hypothetical protein
LHIIRCAERRRWGEPEHYAGSRIDYSRSSEAEEPMLKKTRYPIFQKYFVQLDAEPLGPLLNDFRTNEKQLYHNLSMCNLLNIPYCISILEWTRHQKFNKISRYKWAKDPFAKTLCQKCDRPSQDDLR